MDKAANGEVVSAPAASRFQGLPVIMIVIFCGAHGDALRRLWRILSGMDGHALLGDLTLYSGNVFDGGPAGVSSPW